MSLRQCWQGLVYRAHHPQWAYSPLSGEGAKLHGGRFNRPGTAALYTSLDFTTAWLEAQQGFSFKPQSLTLVVYQVDCEDIVDLRLELNQQQLAVNGDDLGCAWEWLRLNQQLPPTWLLADRLRAMGIAGIIVQSFAPGCTHEHHNLVLWDWATFKPHALQVIDDLNRLPRNLDF